MSLLLNIFGYLTVLLRGARWVGLRTDPPESRVAAWIWPICFTFVGLILVLYREA